MNTYFGATPDQLQPLGEDPGKPVLLHVSHSWGGGVDRWVRDFSRADQTHWHLLLASRTGRNAAGTRLELLDINADDGLLLAWDLVPSVPGIAVQHAGYRAIVAEIANAFPVSSVVISSLIGHSLEAFDTGVPTVLVLHDLVPFCPALFAWFDGSCASCGENRLKNCLDSNPLNYFWYQRDVGYWVGLRRAFAERLVAADVAIVSPSRSAWQRYSTLFPVLDDRKVKVIPHGIDDALVGSTGDATDSDAPAHPQDGRLRIVIPARLAPHKGLDLFTALLPQLQTFARVLLLGCGEFGAPFREREGVTVVPDYRNAELRSYIEAFRPDCALLLSQLPESFSYTLSEMSALGVPVVATRLGALAERIEDGRNGFLVDPEPSSILSCLQRLDDSRDDLHRISRRLRQTPVRSATDMVKDYLNLAVFSGGAARVTKAAGDSLAVAIVRQSRARAFLVGQNAEVGDACATARSELATLRPKAAELDRLSARLEQVQSALSACERRHAADLAGIRSLTMSLSRVAAERDAIVGSLSWRLTNPVRRLLVRLGFRASKRIASAAADSARAVSATVADDAVVSVAECESPPVDQQAPVETIDAALSRAAKARTGQLEFFAGDLLGLAQAHCLTRTLASLRDGTPDGPKNTAPEGFSLVLSTGTDSAGTHLSACFDGLIHPPSAACTELAGAVDVVAAPNAALAKQFRQLWPDVGARLITGYPLLTMTCDSAETQATRIGQRRKLGLPDDMRIVIGVGQTGERAGLDLFALLAMETCRRLNGVRFIWLGTRNPPWEARSWQSTGMALALKQLFIVADADIVRWFQAADAYVGCRQAGLYDDGATLALRMRLPVCVASRHSLLDTVDRPGFDGCVTEASGKDAVQWVVDHLARGAATSGFTRNDASCADLAEALAAMDDQRIVLALCGDGN